MKKINSFYILSTLLYFNIFEIGNFYGSDVKAPFTDDFYY